MLVSSDKLETLTKTQMFQTKPYDLNHSNHGKDCTSFHPFNQKVQIFCTRKPFSYLIFKFTVKQKIANLLYKTPHRAIFVNSPQFSSSAFLSYFITKIK